MIKRFCPRGHDKLVVGVAENRQCAECQRMFHTYRNRQFKRRWLMARKVERIAVLEREM